MVANSDYFKDYADTSGEMSNSQFSVENLLQNQKVRTVAFGIASGALGKVDTGYNLKTPDYDHRSTTTPSVNGSGFPATSDGSSLGSAISVSDLCVVGDEVWFFGASSDDNLTYGTCWRIKYDPVNNEMLEDPKFFWHNWGHVNTINYNPDNDCLIMGNGSADYNLGNKIFIIPNASAIKNMENGAVVSLEDYGFVIDVSNQEAFGKKLNVFWSNTTGLVYKYAGDKMLPNLAYAYSDDGNKFHIIVLGFGSYQYPMGTYKEPTDSCRWNGTYNILKTYQIGDANETVGNPGSYTHCGQGGSALAGSAYIGRGHSSFWISEIIPNGNDFIESTKNIVNYNWQTGTVGNHKIMGLELTNNYLIVARSAQSGNPMINFIPR
jgi:hypothetical protein